jgi:glycosyltransferase involved in cell wall biosynthesis
MMISIITPSFNMKDYLPLAAQSIADQSYQDYEHIIMDGNSTDGTAQWLETKPFTKMKSISEPDNGMYEAINKGLKRAKGDILSYLNCDEQYLPGTLEYVSNYFDTHPKVDIIFGDALLIKPDGSLIAYRKGYQPRWPFILSSHLYVLSCTMFFRRNIMEKGFLFDTRYKAVGDADFVVRLLQNQFKAKHLKRFFSTFTMTGQNLSTDNRAISEQHELLQNAPASIRVIKPVLNLLRLGEKVLSGAYKQGGPIQYDVYTQDQNNTDSKKRKQFAVEKASFRWRFQ